MSFNDTTQQLKEQLQAQYGNIGKVSSIVGYLNVEYLRNELWNMGYNTKLADDSKTVILESRIVQGA